MKTTLKPALVAALIAACGCAAAQAPATPPVTGNPANFAQHKQKELDRIALHLQTMQSLQSCVQAAADHAAVKQCHEAARASMGHRGS